MKILSFIIILVVAFSSTAQTSFYSIYTEGGFDYGNDIIQLPDDSYLITGASSSFGDAPSQAFLLNIDDEGNYLWSQNYGGGANEEGRKVIHQPGVGYYVAGFTTSFGAGDFDAYILMTDENGVFQWEKNFGGAGWDRIWDAAVAPDGTLVLVGSSDSFGAGQNDIMVMRIDASGNEIWTEYIGTSGQDEARAVRMVNDTTFLVGGTIYNETSEDNQIYLRSMTLNQEVIFENEYGTSGDDALLKITNVDNKYQLFGRTNNDMTMDDAGYVVITDENGVYETDRTDDKPGDSQFDCAVPYQNGTDIFVVISVFNDDGVSTFPGGTDANFHSFTNDVYYNFLSWSIFNSNGPDIPGDLFATSDGGAIYVGTESFFGTGGASIVVVKFGPNYEAEATGTVPTTNQLVTIEDAQLDSEILMYPNPVLDQLTIESQDLQGFQLEVFNLLGELVYQTKISGAIEQVNTSSWNAGMYSVRLSNENMVITQKIVK